MRIRKNKEFYVRIKTNFKPISLSINVGTSLENKLIITAFDSELESTFLFNREARPESNKTYLFGIPKTGEFLDVLIYSVNPNIEFDVNEIIVNPISEYKAVNLFVDEKTKKFQDFIKDFSFNFSELKLGIHSDKDNLFQIEILPEIIDTPTRIGEISNKIQISRVDFINRTVSQRSLMSCHEYAHNYLNEDPDSEFEADVNGLQVYLSMKYPVIEAYNTFLSLSPTGYSIQRLLNAERYLKQYEKNLIQNNE